jgi:hypothetical protein
LKLKHHDMLELVKSIFERSKDDDVKDRLPDGKVPGKELANIEGGASLDFDAYFKFFLHDIGVKYEVIPRVDNRRLRTTGSEDEAEAKEENAEVQDGENEYIDLEQIKKLDEDY